MHSQHRSATGLKLIRESVASPRVVATVETGVYLAALGAVAEGQIIDGKSLSYFTAVELIPALIRSGVPESRRKNLSTYFKMCVRAALSAGIPAVEAAVHRAGSFRQAYERMYLRDLIDGAPLGRTKPIPS